MGALTKAALVAVASFVCALIGFALQAAAPAQALQDAHGMINSIAGLVSLLLALVLGLVIWTSHGVYTTQVAEAQSLGPIVMQLDHEFEQLGSKGTEGRDLLKSLVLSHRDRFWGEGRARRAYTSYAVSKSDTRAMAEFLSRVVPSDDNERRLVASAEQLSASMIRTQLLMARQLTAPLSPILLIVVVGWSLFLFFSYGLSSPPNVVSVAITGLGAIAVASAFLLILELTDPYDGLFRISPDGIDHVLATIGVRETTRV